MSDQQTKDLVDGLLDEASYLHFGVPYEALTAFKQDKMIQEVCLRYSSQQLEAADQARKMERES